MISIYLNGRLGNQLFQYIKVRIEAIKNNCNYYIPSTVEESISIYGTCSRKFGRYFELPVESNPHYWTGNSLFEIDFGINDGNISTIINECEGTIMDGTFLCGYYQTDSHFSDKEEYIKNTLKFTSKIKDDSIEFINEFNPNEFCYIHFRGGDYVNIKNWFLPQKYYSDSIEFIKNKFDINKFVIVTDDYEEAKSLFPLYPILSNSQEIDFYLISQSKYTIIPNSSFSWWAAWLKFNNIITIAPNGWFNYNCNGEFEPSGIKTNKFTYL